MMFATAAMKLSMAISSWPYSAHHTTAVLIMMQLFCICPASYSIDLLGSTFFHKFIFVFRIFKTHWTKSKSFETLLDKFNISNGNRNRFGEELLFMYENRAAMEENDCKKLRDLRQKVAFLNELFRKSRPPSLARASPSVSASRASSAKS